MFTAVAIKYEQRDPNRPFVAVQRYSHQMPRTLLSQVVYEPFDSLGFQWFLDVSSSMRQINNHGSYSLFYFYSFYRLKDGGPYNIPYITTLCFNVLTEKFSCPALAFPTSCAPGAYELRDTSRKWHKLFDSRLRVAEQVHIWNGEFFSLSWETERSKVSPPSLNSTKLMDEDLAGDQLLRALNDAPRSEISSFQDMPIEEDDEGRSRTPIIWGSCYWRIFGDDNMLVVLTDNGYYVVHCRGDNRKFDWLLEGLGRRVGRGAHLPDLGHGGLRDVLFRMSHRYGDTRAGSWSDDEDPEYNIEAHE